MSATIKNTADVPDDVRQALDEVLGVLGKYKWATAINAASTLVVVMAAMVEMDNDSFEMMLRQMRENRSKVEVVITRPS